MVLCILMGWLAAAPVFASHTVIQGNAFYYRGKTLELRAYSDLFTFQSKVLTTVDIPADGSFKIEIDLDDEGLYLLAIERVFAHLFIKPGDQYTLVLPEPIAADQYVTAKDVFILPEIFESKYRLNYDITAVERKINQFLLDNAKYYGRGVNRKIIPLADSLASSLRETYADHPLEYFQTYLHFRLATLALQTNHSRNEVFDTYFKHRPPAYDQLSYANAFTLFFEEYFDYLHPIRAHRFQATADSAIRTNDFGLLMECMKVDPHLPSEEVRQLLAATQLYELGAERKYPRPVILALLDSLLIHASDEACKIIAANAQEVLNHLAPGTMAPDFEFTDLVGNIYRISEYQGRQIYLQFFDDFDKETLKEMSLMKVLKEGYGTDIAMFSISTSENLDKLKSISKQYDFDWFFGKVLTPSETIRHYDLRAFPSYFYLDKDLRFIQSPASPPGAKIEKLFARSWNEAHPNKQLRFKLQPPDVSEEPALKPID